MFKRELEPDLKDVAIRDLLFSLMQPNLTGFSYETDIIS